MNLPVHLKQLAIRVGLHEAGHYVIARTLGFRTGGCFIKLIGPFDEHEGGSVIKLYRPMDSHAEILRFLQERVQVLYAGALAQSLNAGEIVNDAAIDCLKNHSGKGDYDKARELIQVIRNIKYPASDSEEDIQEELSEIEAELWNKSACLVMNEREIIEGLGLRIADEVKCLDQKFELDGSVIDSLPAIVQRFGS